MTQFFVYQINLDFEIFPIKLIEMEEQLIITQIQGSQMELWLLSLILMT
jgi:hypothetical protein